MLCNSRSRRKTKRRLILPRRPPGDINEAAMRRTKWWHTCLSDREEEIVLQAYAEAVESGVATSKSNYVRKAIMKYSLELRKEKQQAQNWNY
jgi:hypothetical protein